MGQGRFSKRFLKVAATSLVLCLPSTLAAANPPGRAPIQAVLVKSLQADHVKAGDSVLAKVSVEWKGQQCELRRGAILQGRVVAAVPRSKTSKSSELAMVFDTGQCGGTAMQPLPLTVAAVVAPIPDTNEGLYEGDQTMPLSAAPGLSIGGSSPIGPALGGSGGGGLRSVQGAAATIYSMAPRPRMPKTVMPGQTVGLKGIKLSVGSGPEGSSVLSSTKHNVRLESGSQLVLVARLTSPTASAAPAPASTPPSASTRSAATAAAPAAVTDEFPEETEICAPPHCNMALATDEADFKAGRASATLSVKELGFPLPPTREMYGLDYEAAVTYLGSKELLFSFNPHRMVPRSGPELEGRTVRVIRGVLINVASRKVERVVDWRVQDHKRYLWSVGHEGALIHSGDELRLYGPGLKLREKLSLGGPLSFVRISPSGSYIAVGVLHERHTEAVHRELAQAENREPEEDVQVRVLNGSLHTLTTVARSSWEAPPVLLDQGEIRIPTTGRNHWRVIEYDWTGQRKVVTQFSSTCAPEAASLPPNLLFVVGCDARATGKWYRVLGQDGKLVLKGWSSAEALDRVAAGSMEGGAFAVAVAKATHALAPDVVFHANDLQSEYIGVYSAENGRRMFGLTVPSPVPTEQTFALSPDGEQLAVLGEDQLSLYAVPGTVDARK